MFANEWYLNTQQVDQCTLYAHTHTPTHTYTFCTHIETSLFINTPVPPSIDWYMLTQAEHHIGMIYYTEILFLIHFTYTISKIARITHLFWYPQWEPVCFFLCTFLYLFVYYVCICVRHKQTACWIPLFFFFVQNKRRKKKQNCFLFYRFRIPVYIHKFHKYSMLNTLHLYCLKHNAYAFVYMGSARAFVLAVANYFICVCGQRYIWARACFPTGTSRFNCTIASCRTLVYVC